MPPGGLCPGRSPLPRPPFPAPCPPFASPPHFADDAKGGPDRTAVGYAHGGPSDGHRHLITAVVIGASVVAFFFLVLLPVSYVILRRRQLRRRQQALLAAGGPAAAANADDGDDPEGGGGVVHHVWYIQTVGLDEAAINSIAVTQYRAGAGFLGSADCSVCLGEFQDGELVRLLPKCGHAFHVPCIDTWLRAHVNCPICRSDVLDPSSTAAAGESNPPADANAGATGEQAAGNGILDPDEEDEQEVPPVQPEQYEQFSSPELLPQLPASRLRDVRRAASMDAAIVSAVVDVAALERLPEVGPEEEQGGREKRGNGAVCDKVSSCSGHLSHLRIERSLSGRGPRLFLSRHCRARSSVLPL